MISKRYRLWAIYTIFTCAAFALNWHDRIFAFDGPHALAKVAVWATWIAFVLYSLYCTKEENFFRTLRHINQFHWARQIGIDLYIGVGLFFVLVYLHSGSLLVLLLWFPFILFFANLGSLVYLAIFFDDIAQMLIRV